MLDWGGMYGTTGSFGTGTGNAFGNASGASGGESMMVDEDYMELMTDTLFSTISSNQPLYFPDPREIGNSFRVVQSARYLFICILEIEAFFIFIIIFRASFTNLCLVNQSVNPLELTNRICYNSQCD